MPTTYIALNILIILFPGFLCSHIIDAIVEREKKDQFERIIESLILSTFIYMVYFISSRAPAFIISGENLSFSIGSFFYFIVASLVLAILVGLNSNYDLLSKLFRLIKITKKTARKTVWLDIIMNNPDRYIIVNLKNKKRLRGFLCQASGDFENPYLFLSNLAWIQKDDSTGEITETELNDLEGIFIPPQAEIEYIEIYKKQEEDKEE